jgi:membrane dipeptidase
MIRRLSAAGGMTHIAFHNSFLSQEYATAYRSLSAETAARQQEVANKFGENEAQILMEGQKWSDAAIRAGKLPQVSWGKIVEHIDHVVAVAGVEHVGIGSDFDGAFMPEGMEDASALPRITEGLVRLGYNDSDIQKILGKNTLQVMAKVEQTSQELSARNS